MIHLYGMGSPNVLKVLILLEEIGLDYAFTRIDVMAGEQFGEAFLRLNPNGKVPVIVDDEAPGGPLAVFESGAILLYLAEKTGVLWPGELSTRAACHQWLMFQMAGFGPISGQAIHFNYATKQDGYARTRFTNELDRLVAVVERRLGESAYIAGPDYSIADVALLPWVRTLRQIFAEHAMASALEQPNIRRWHDGLTARPAVQKAVEFAAGLSGKDWKAMREADRPARDRYFGRVPHSRD